MATLVRETAAAQNVSPHMVPLDTEAVLEKVLPILPYGKEEAHLTLAALIEMQGVNDSIVRSYGMATVFELAAQLLVTAPTQSPASGTTMALSSPPKFVAWWRCLIFGLTQAGVMILLLAIIALGEYGLHALGIQPLTMIFATIVATMSAGGLLQLSAWLIGVALGRGGRHSLRLAYRQAFLIGLGITAATALIGLLGGYLADLEPKTALVFAAIIVVLTPLLLSSGQLVLLQRPLQTLGTLAIASGSAWVATMVYATHPVATDVSVILIATIALVAQAEFSIWRRGETKERRPRRLPPKAIVWLSTAPFVGYGILTVILVFVAQPVIWIGADPFSGELLRLLHLAGLTLFILSQGAFEAGMTSLWSVGTAIQHQFTLKQVGQAGKALLNFILTTMRRALLVQLVLSGVIGSTAFWLIGSRMNGISWTAIGLALLGTMLGYGLLGHTLFLCGVLNVFGDRWLVVRALVQSVAVSGISAKLTLAYVSPLVSVVGIIVGSLTLFILVVGEFQRLLRDSDYALYRGFS